MVQEPLSSAATAATSADATDETIAPAETKPISNSIGNETSLVTQADSAEDEDEDDEDSDEDEEDEDE